MNLTKKEMQTLISILNTEIIETIELIKEVDKADAKELAKHLKVVESKLGKL